MKISIKLLLHLECFNACTAHFEGLHPEFGRKFEDLSEIDYPLWFVDLESYEPGDEISKMAEALFDLKENVKLRARVNKEGVFTYILIKDSHPNLFRQVEASIIVFSIRWKVESSFSAVLNVFS